MTRFTISFNYTGTEATMANLKAYLEDLLVRCGCMDVRVQANGPVDVATD